MLLGSRWSKIVFGTVVVLLLVGIALYQINEWWPGCNFVRGWYHSEPAGEPLIIAAAGAGCTGCVRTLLRHGTDPNIEDNIYTVRHSSPLFSMGTTGQRGCC